MACSCFGFVWFQIWICLVSDLVLWRFVFWFLVSWCCGVSCFVVSVFLVLCRFLFSFCLVSDLVLWRFLFWFWFLGVVAFPVLSFRFSWLCCVSCFVFFGFLVCIFVHLVIDVRGA